MPRHDGVGVCSTEKVSNRPTGERAKWLPVCRLPRPAGLEAGHGLASVLAHNALIEGSQSEYSAGEVCGQVGLGLKGGLEEVGPKCPGGSTGQAWLAPFSRRSSTARRRPLHACHTAPCSYACATCPLPPLPVFPKMSTCSATTCSALSAVATGASLAAYFSESGAWVACMGPLARGLSLCMLPSHAKQCF